MNRKCLSFGTVDKFLYADHFFFFLLKNRNKWLGIIFWTSWRNTRKLTLILFVLKNKKIWGYLCLLSNELTKTPEADLLFVFKKSLVLTILPFEGSWRGKMGIGIGRFLLWKNGIQATGTRIRSLEMRKKCQK